MTDKPAKKKKPGEKLNNIPPEYDSVREQTVLLEHMNQGIQTIAEQHSSIVEKLDQHSGDLSVIKSELDTVKIATMENSHRIKVLEVGQEELKSGQEELKGDIQELKGGFQELKGDVKEIKQKLDIVITDHEQRLTKIEAIR